MPRPIARDKVKAALPGSISQLVAKTGLAESTLRHWLNDMRDAEPKECRIYQWRRKNGAPSPVYVAGPGPDAPKPEARTNADYSRKWRRVHRKEHQDMRQERAQVQAETRAAIRAATSVPKNWASTLIGSSHG